MNLPPPPTPALLLSLTDRQSCVNQPHEIASQTRDRRSDDLSFLKILDKYSYYCSRSRQKLMLSLT